VLTYMLVFLAGVLVGLAELLSRHRDYPVQAALSFPSFGYMILNGALSVVALLIVSLSPPEWLKSGTELDPLKTVLLVGFGAAAFFRSSFFKLRTPEGEISVGPGLIIDVFLRVIDDAVDRKLGGQRLDDASEIMAQVSFAKAAKALPTYCFAGLRRLSPEAQQQAALQIRSLSELNDMDDRAKAVALGLTIMSLTGKPILKKGVDQLGDRIIGTPPAV
jgi:hypothetical protein